MGSRRQAHLNITNKAPDDSQYLGANANTGQIKIEADGFGWKVYDLKSQVYRYLGPRITLAMVMTEWCVKNGRGKIFYFAKEISATFDIPPRYTRDYMRLPDLLYADFVWDQASQDEWFKRPQWQRMDLLSARGNALHSTTPIIPISLVYEAKDYAKIRFVEGLPGSISMYFNKHGYMYFGFPTDMAPHMLWHHVNQPTATALALPNFREKVPFWEADKTDVAPFQVTSGADAAQRLRNLYIQGQHSKVRLYRTVMTLSIQAHDNWSANGGYSIEADSTLGPDVAQRCRDAIRRDRRRTGGGTRLEELEEIVSQWDAFKQLAKDGFKAAARQGVPTLTRFTIRDQQWKDLSDEEKEILVELYELEQDLHEGDAARDEAAGGDTAGGDTAGGDTAGGDTAGGDTAGGDTAGGDTAGGDTAGGDTAGGDTAGGDTAGGDNAEGDDIQSNDDRTPRSNNQVLMEARGTLRRRLPVRRSAQSISQHVSGDQNDDVDE